MTPDARNPLRTRSTPPDRSRRDVLRTTEVWPARWTRKTHRWAKRALDVVVSGLGLLVLSPLLLAIGILVARSSPGPVLFTQTRIGRGGRPFQIYKFRTMHINSDASQHQAYYRRLVAGEAQATGGSFKLMEDPRVTRLGRVLRRLSLDELPQLINVVRGDMSLVGPRPPIAYEVELYDQRALQRLAVPPGITGLWQVSGRNTLNFQQMIDLDLAYISRWSFWFDVQILIRTPLVVLMGKGAH